MTQLISKPSPGGKLWYVGSSYAPDTVIVALLPEAGSNGGALFLNYGSLVGNRLCGSDVANKLLDYWGFIKVSNGLSRLGRSGLGIMDYVAGRTYGNSWRCNH